MDILGEIPTPPARPSTTDTIGGRPPPSKATVPPKASKPADSLLGLDFLSGPPLQSAGKPSSAATTPGAPSSQSRPDLKQSILSLYASTPKPQPAQQQDQGHNRQHSFGGMQSPQATGSSSLGGLNDAFSGLGFSSPTSPPASTLQQQPKPDFFSNFSNPMKSKPQRSDPAPPQLSSPPLSGGSFFDTAPKSAPKIEVKPATSQPSKTNNILSTSDTDFGDFSFASSPPKPAASQPASKPASSNLFDMSGFASQISPPAPPTPSAVPAAPPPTSVSSPFNLSTQPAPPAPKPAPTAAPPVSTTSNTVSNISNADIWGSNDAWGSSEPTAITASAHQPQTTSSKSKASAMDTMAWPSTTSTGIPLGGSSSRGQPVVAQDEDFGGWSSAVPVASSGQTTQTTSNSTSKPSGGGFGGGDDLFSNVWG